MSFIGILPVFPQYGAKLKIFRPTYPKFLGNVTGNTHTFLFVDVTERREPINFNIKGQGQCNLFRQHFVVQCNGQHKTFSTLRLYQYQMLKDEERKRTLANFGVDSSKVNVTVTCSLQGYHRLSVLVLH